MTGSNVVAKTKQSLPNRGLTSSAKQWMANKTVRDADLWQNQQHLWIVENKLYDLSPYVNSHPGGSHWLALTKGQDITQHFITHHLNENKARSVLQKYFVGEVKRKQELRFTFQPQGLFRKVKKSLLEKYSPEVLQDTSKSVVDGCIFIGLWILAFLAMAYYQSYLLAIVCGALIYAIIGVAHNFIHMKNHPFRFLWSFTGFSHKQWQITHCLSHHTYSNTLLDYQIQVFEPLIYYLTVSPKNTKIKWVMKQILLSTVTITNMFLQTLIIPLSKRTKPQLFYMIPLLQIPLIFSITNDIGLSLKLFLTIHISFSIIFTKMTFITHRTGADWTEGNVEIRDFAEHQVNAVTEATTDNCRGFLSYLLYAGFNFHAVHHLFPTIDNHYLPEASAILQEQALKKGIKLKKHKSILSALIQVQRNFFERKAWKRQ